MTARAHPAKTGAQILTWILTGSVAFAVGLAAGGAKAAEIGHLRSKVSLSLSAEPGIHQAGLPYQF